MVCTLCGQGALVILSKACIRRFSQGMYLQVGENSSNHEDTTIWTVMLFASYIYFLKNLRQQH